MWGQSVGGTLFSSKEPRTGKRVGGSRSQVFLRHSLTRAPFSLPPATGLSLWAGLVLQVLVGVHPVSSLAPWSVVLSDRPSLVVDIAGTLVVVVVVVRVETEPTLFYFRQAIDLLDQLNRLVELIGFCLVGCYNPDSLKSESSLLMSAGIT